MKISKRSRLLLRCPVCGADLLIDENDAECLCTGSQCATRFPIVDGIPVLINDTNSAFAIDDFRERRNTTFRSTSLPSRIIRKVGAALPQLTGNTTATANYQKFAEMLLERASPNVLVIGGGIIGQGMDVLLATQVIEFVETDVAFGTQTQLICDAHDLPFIDQSFDGVVAQAVLEHVADPQRCVEEIYRILKPKGVVYAETPFMQQVHLGRYDFTRFTHLGHRRLFRRFDEIVSGATAGQGTVLAWSHRYLLLGLVQSEIGIVIVKAFAQLGLFWLKYLDRFLMHRRGVFDGASGYYFLGSKSDKIFSDRELIKQYRGIL